ncbi:minor tail protein [Gordonia phage Mollymur]|uniref:Minor tail protein n=1 Tax=Gordonia phage Mollymur TaxID=2590895 RepID=A0A4Y6E9Z2_9CAUD|nr:minor tail protein [Gordonia phage Mollymur]QDF15398.1 minor tail protein [Gordonia phage Mollymur]
MTTYDELYGPPVDVLHPTINVYAVDDGEGLPIRHLAVYLTPGEGRMELPRGKPGPKGDKGDPVAPWIVKGDKTTAGLAALNLGPAEAGFAWRNTDTNALHYWSGGAWVVLADAVGAEGPVGPAGSIAGVNIEMKDPDTEPEAYITGAPGNQVLSIRIPEKPGPQGNTGPAAAIGVASDYDATITPAAGDVLTRLPSGKWGPGTSPKMRYYSVPEGSFTDTGDFGGSRQTLFTLSLDQVSYASWLEISGHLRGGIGLPGASMAVEVRVGDAANGELIARGYTNSRTGEHVIDVKPHYSTNAQPNRLVSPGGSVGVIPANHTGNAGTIYVTAVRTSGLGSVRAYADDGQLIIKRYPAA